MAGANRSLVLKSSDFDTGSIFERWIGSLDTRPRLIITRDLEVIWQSSNAAPLILPPIPLRLKKGHLEADTGNMSEQLAKFIANVGEECESFLVKGKKHWAMVLALSPEKDPNLVFVMLNLSVPSSGVQQSGLAGAIGLTNAEGRVLDKFASLYTPREIAESMNVSLSTVRSHLKQIHSKAGVRSAVELTQFVRGYCSF